MVLNFKTAQKHLRLSNYLKSNQCIIDKNELPEDWLMQLKILSNQCHCSLLEPSDDNIKDYLSQVKKQFIKYWCCARVTAAVEQQTLGKLYATFADKSLQFIFRNLLLRADFKKYGIKLTKTGLPQGLFVIGLGKLGGRDLNFSSDIDLIAFYSNQLFQVKQQYGKKEAANALLKKMTQLLSYREGGKIWRVDWNLRPDSSSPGLVMSFDEAMQFYSKRAPIWHRLALVKARPVAGDIAVGQTFVRQVSDYLWHKGFDYTVVDEMLYLKLRLNNEHPRMQTQQQQETITKSCQHFNVKLGHGGIREIEFLIYAKQLLFGGMYSKLQTTSTLKALQFLVQLNLINESEGQVLYDAYCYFRLIEDYLQMIDNHHIHTIPNNENWAKLTQLLQSDANKVANKIYHLRQLVYRQFHLFFKNMKVLDLDAKQVSPIKFPQLNEESNQILTHWQEGFIIYGINPSEGAHFANHLYPKLLQAIEQYTKDYNVAITTMHALFSNLPNSTKIFRLILNFYAVLDNLVCVALNVPTLFNLLKLSPKLVEYLMVKEYTEWQTTLKSNQSLQQKMQFVRSQLNARLAYLYLPIARGNNSLLKLQRQLTVLASDAVETCVEITCNELNIDNAPITIIAYGRFATYRMNPLSDIDLVYITDEEQSLAIKFSEQLNHILQMQMEDGLVYQVDNRLRPYGSSGPLCVNYQLWFEHLATRAYTWEHVALVFSRVVFGKQQLQKHCIKMKKSIFQSKRDLNRCQMDILKMLDRIRKQRGTTNFDLDIKQMIGGIIELDFYIATAILLNPEQNNRFFKSDYLPNIKIIGQFMQCPKLAEINGFYDKLQGLIKLFNLENKMYDEVSEFHQKIFCQHFKVATFAKIVAQIEQSKVVVKNLIESILNFEDNKNNIEDWQEQPVNLK